METPSDTAAHPAWQSRERVREFATMWRAADKVVFSTTLARASTPRTRIERTFEPDQVRRLKTTSELDLTVGGPDLAGAMIAANLVDELQAFIHPIMVGGGHPWLPCDLRVPLELVGERRLGRVVRLRYRPRQDLAPARSSEFAAASSVSGE